MKSKYIAYLPYHDCKSKLSAEEIVHYGKVVTAMEENIRLTGDVDGVIYVNGRWPIK